MQKRSRNCKKQIFIKPSFLQKYIIFLLIDLFILIFIIFFCKLDEIVYVEGQIRPVAEEIYIYSLYSGTVKDKYYENAQYVNQGDVLIVQDSSYDEENLKNLLELKKMYEVSTNNYEDLLTILNKTTIFRCELNERKFSNNILCASFFSQYKNYSSILEHKRKKLERNKKIYPSMISAEELENIENELLQVEYSFSTWLEEQKISALESYSEYMHKKDSCELEILKTSQLIANSTVIAKKSGFINETIKIYKGDYLDAGEKILAIIPDGDELKAVLPVNNYNISKIKIGQDVLLQIKDLPYTKYGKLYGKITRISKDVVNEGSSYFLIDVLMSKNFLQFKKGWNEKDRIFLKVGSEISAKIIVDSNTIFQRIIQGLVLLW